MKIWPLNFVIGMAVVLGLGACQTLGGPSPAAVMRLEEAGYEGLRSARSVSLGPSSLSAAYICAPEKCGKLNVVVFGGGTVPSSTTISAEEQIRRGVFTDAAAKRLLQTAFTAQKNSVLKVTRLRQFVTPAEVGFTFSAKDKDGAGRPLYLQGHGVVVGNRTDIIVSLAENEAQSRRGLALATAR